MVTRNLTEVFLLMRNNALQTKHIYAEQNLSDRMALVELGEPNSFEMDGCKSENTAPPPWIDALDETQYILSRLRVKIDTLIDLHSKQLTRPTLDDTSQEERQIDQLTREISRAFSTGYRQVQTIKNESQNEIKPAERRLAMNAVIALSSALQDLAMRYRSAQNHYLQQINSREERNRKFFEEEQITVLNGSVSSWHSELIQEDLNLSSWPQSLQKQQQSLLSFDDAEENIKLAMQREEEVSQIVRSISELNYIFKDLANMVQDQGTILDRIDYNIEQTQVQVREGYQQLKKADSYQRTNRKIYCIFILSGAIILLSFLFVVFKT